MTGRVSSSLREQATRDVDPAGEETGLLQARRVSRKTSESASMSGSLVDHAASEVFASLPLDSTPDPAGVSSSIGVLDLGILGSRPSSRGVSEDLPRDLSIHDRVAALVRSHQEYGLHFAAITAVFDSTPEELNALSFDELMNLLESYETYSFEHKEIICRNLDDRIKANPSCLEGRSLDQLFLLVRLFQDYDFYQPHICNAINVLITDDNINTLGFSISILAQYFEKCGLSNRLMRDALTEIMEEEEPVFYCLTESECMSLLNFYVIGDSFNDLIFEKMKKSDPGILRALFLSKLALCLEKFMRYDEWICQKISERPNDEQREAFHKLDLLHLLRLAFYFASCECVSPILFEKVSNGVQAPGALDDMNSIDLLKLAAFYGSCEQSDNSIGNLVNNIITEDEDDLLEQLDLQDLQHLILFSNKYNAFSLDVVNAINQKISEKDQVSDSEVEED